MKPETWKLIAMICILICVIETSLIVWGMVIVRQEEVNTNICFYDFCAGYPDAMYEAGVCECYDYSIIGEMVVADSTYLG